MLTTLYLYRLWSGSAATGEDARTEAVIAAASAAIATYCGRTFALTEYRKWLDGSGAGWMLLPAWPITRLYGVALASDDALVISHATAQYAAVEVTATGVTIASVTAGTLTETVLSFATYKTIATLAAAINAVSGWTATVQSGMDDRPSVMLRPEASACATVNSEEATLQLPLEPFAPVDIMPNTDRAIRLRDECASGFPVGRSNVFVWYKAGYTEPVDAAGHASLATAGDVPADLTLAANALVKAALDDAAVAGGGITSEKMGDYSYTISDALASGMAATLTSKMAPMLAPYRRLV